jgi:hypothetical protein
LQGSFLPVRVFSVDTRQAAPPRLVPVNFATGPGIKEFRIIGMNALALDLAIDAGSAHGISTIFDVLGRKHLHNSFQKASEI